MDDGTGDTSPPHAPARRRPDLSPCDCATVCAWFGSRGLEVDEQELFAELMAHAF